MSLQVCVDFFCDYSVTPTKQIDSVIPSRHGDQSKCFHCDLYAFQVLLYSCIVKMFFKTINGCYFENILYDI